MILDFIKYTGVFLTYIFVLVIQFHKYYTNIYYLYFITDKHEKKNT